MSKLSKLLGLDKHPAILDAINSISHTVLKQYAPEVKKDILAAAAKHGLDPVVAGLVADEVVAAMLA